MNRVRKLTVISLVSLLGAGGALAVPTTASASTQVYCSVTAKLNLGRGQATSTCVGPGPLKVNQHRAVIMCTVERGRGDMHDITFTSYGPWAEVGKKSTVTCPFSSSTAGFSYQTR
jgi:hypothetical protein